MVSTQTSGKRKPPTFQHLPTNRARKLKQTWVDTKKVKSQWRAQKKKEGLLQRRDTPITEGVDIVEGNDGENVESDNLGSKNADRDQKSTRGPMKGHPQRPPSYDAKQHTDPKKEHSQNTQRNQDLSKRELRKLAFSPSSLHTKKSNSNRSQGRHGADRDGRKQSRERSHNGKGQPDMKLRMSAMLEKIKRDLS